MFTCESLHLTEIRVMTAWTGGTGKIPWRPASWLWIGFYDLDHSPFFYGENTPWLNVVDTLQRQLSTNPPLYLCMCQSFHQAVDSASLALNLDWLCGRLQPIGLVAEVISASAGAQPFPARQLLHLLSWNISHAIRNSCWSQAILLKSKVTRKGF